MPKTQPPLSTVLPPLIAGTATFNSQYNPDPYAIPSTAIVHQALNLGVRAFDTSPYYGPSEILLGGALATPFVNDDFPRNTYVLATKVGRISANSFDYSPEWVRQSVKRSLQRLHTDYLDVVYCHDVEFVSAEETLAAIIELRRLRDEHRLVRYVGICGYPIPLLCSRAEYVLEKTGEPLDVVQSYANYTLQNTQLLSTGVERFKKAGVDVVPNASVLGMGLLRRQGIPIGGQGDWHPAPKGLREKVVEASEWCDSVGEKMEKLAIRFSMEGWMRDGSDLGSSADPPSGQEGTQQQKILAQNGGGKTEAKGIATWKLGVNVMGVSTLSELDETMRVWRSILKTLDGDTPATTDSTNTDTTKLSAKFSHSSSTDRPPQSILKVANVSHLEATAANSLRNNSITTVNSTTLTPSSTTTRPSDTTTTDTKILGQPSSEEEDHAWGLRRRVQVLERAAEVRRILGKEWADFSWDSPEKGFVNQRLANGTNGERKEGED